MTTRQRLLFRRPIKAKPEPTGNIDGCRPAPEGREWLRSFLAPEQLPPEVLPTITHKPRRTKP